MNKADIQELEGLLSVPVAANVLGVTRQRVFQLAVDEGKLTFIRRISGAGERPAAYVVSKDEILKLVEDQKKATAEAAAKEKAAVAEAAAKEKIAVG